MTNFNSHKFKVSSEKASRTEERKTAMAHRNIEPTRAQSARSTRVACSVSRPAGCGVATGSVAHYLLAVVVVGLCVVEARLPPSRQAGFLAGPVLAGAPRTHSHAAWKQQGVRIAKFLPLVAPTRGTNLGLNAPVPQAPAPDAAGNELVPLPMPRQMQQALPAQAQCPQDLVAPSSDLVAPRSEEVRASNLGEKLAAGYTAGLVARPLRTKMLTNLVSAVAASMATQARLPLCLTPDVSQVDTVLFFLPTFATWTFLSSYFCHFLFLQRRHGLSLSAGPDSMQIGAVLNLRTPTSQKCEAVPRRDRI